MTYFPDGSKYAYLPDDADGPIVNMGWLDSRHDYPVGASAPELIRALRVLCRYGVNRTRGYHPCELCQGDGDDSWMTGTTVGDARSGFVVGGAEIRVAGEGGTVFASPDMIVHYVEAHHYRPSDEFVKAVLAQPETGSLA